MKSNPMKTNSMQNNDSYSRSRKKGGSFRIRLGVLLTIWFLYSLFLLILSFRIDPVRENLTGLAYMHNGWIWMALFSSLTSLLMAVLSLILPVFQSDILKKGFLIGCFLMMVFPLVPYQENHGLLNDLHVWGCILSFAAAMLFWFAGILGLNQPGWQASWFNPFIRSTVLIQIFILAFSFALIGICGHVSALAEISFGFLEVSFLSILNLKKMFREKDEQHRSRYNG